jgi:hypothetical protein
MKECVLCGVKIESESEDQSYSYDQFLHEADKHGLVYCKPCREILRSNKSRHIPKDEIIRVDIFQSDYHLPGYIPVASKHGVYYIKPKKKRRVMNIAR